MFRARGVPSSIHPDFGFSFLPEMPETAPARFVIPPASPLYRAAFPAQQARAICGVSTAIPPAPSECEFSLTRKRASADTAEPGPPFRRPLVPPSSNARPIPQPTISPRWAAFSIRQQPRHPLRTKAPSALEPYTKGWNQVLGACLTFTSTLPVRLPRRRRHRPARRRAPVVRRGPRRTQVQRSASPRAASPRSCRKEPRSPAPPPKIQ
jgi:hypothetical protein